MANMISLVTLQVTLCCLIVNLPVGRSVIMPPRFHTSRLDPPLLTPPVLSTAPGGDAGGVPVGLESDNSAYLLSINEGASVDVMINSKSTVTVNLNRAVQEDISVTVTVFSGPDLILFDNGNNSSSHNSSTNPTAAAAAAADSPTTLVISYKANTFGDREVDFHTRNIAGHAEIVCKITKQPKGVKIDDSTAYISVNIGKNAALGIIIYIVGWLYFIAWSMSFYFQVILNYQRKSVVGLNFDFLALNLVGFTFYSIYNFALMFSRQVQKDYYERNTYSRIPVEYNDLFFSLHAFLLTLITVIQCFIYERGAQKVSIPAGFFLGLTSFVGFCLYISYLFQKVAILDVVLYLSYVKLAITLIKYSPQAYMNYKRQATTGWSIHNILLDFTGGLLSLTQMFFLAFNYDDWISIFGNFTKFGLGVISIAFDIVFVLQHYVLYKQVGELEVSTDSIPSPVISQSIRSTSFRPQSDEQSESNNPERS